MENDEILKYVETILGGMAREGMAALGPCVPEDARSLFVRFFAGYGEDHRPTFRLKTGSMVALGASEVQFSIQEIRASSTYFARDAEGKWNVARGSVCNVRRTSDAVVGLSDDVDSLRKLAEILADVRQTKRLRVYLGATGGHVPLSVHSGFAVSNARLSEVRGLTCRPVDDGRAGEIATEGWDYPITIGLGRTNGLLTSIWGRKPFDYFENWLAVGDGQLSAGRTSRPRI